MAKVKDAPRELTVESEAGPHKGWSTFDSGNEGARFHLLHGLVSARVFDVVAAGKLLNELSSLAHSYGYGTADSYLTDASGLSDDEIEANPELAFLRDRLFDDYEEDQYFIEVRTSERALYAAAATPEARDFLGDNAHRLRWDGAWGTIHRIMTDSFRAGRDSRQSIESSSSPAP